MKLFFQPILLLFCVIFYISPETKAQPIFFAHQLKRTASQPLKPVRLPLLISICTDRAALLVEYQERQEVITDSMGKFKMMIGTGNQVRGEYTNVIWSFGSYYLKIETDSSADPSLRFSEIVTMRVPTEIKPDNLEGTVSADTLLSWGTVSVANPKQQRPYKITVDLTSNYVNQRYPADTYPIYRHFEWVDEGGNGIGNALALTYSENTHHSFFLRSKRMGEVKLYEEPFQELSVQSDPGQIIFSLSKPEPVTNLGQTYAIKGPWKIIYFIEWKQ